MKKPKPSITPAKGSASPSRSPSAPKAVDLCASLVQTPGNGIPELEMVAENAASALHVSIGGDSDTEVARKLGALLRDAEDGTRRIVAAGLYIELIASQLPKGQLKTWIDSHQLELGRSPAVIYAWRQMARNVLEACQCAHSYASEWRPVPLHVAIFLPLEQLPKELRLIRDKIDELITGKSYRQLYLKFKNSREVDESIIPVNGGGYHATRRNGTPRRKKRTAAEKAEEEYILSSKEALHTFLVSGDEVGGIAGPKGEKSWDVLTDKKLRELHDMMSDYAAGTMASIKRRAALAKR